MPDIIHFHFPFSEYVRQLNSGFFSKKAVYAIRQSPLGKEGRFVWIFGVNHNTGQTIKELLPSTFSGFMDSYGLARNSARIECNDIVVATTPAAYKDVLKTLDQADVKTDAIYLLFDEHPHEVNSPPETIDFASLSSAVEAAPFDIPIYKLENAVLCPDGSVFIHAGGKWKVVRQTLLETTAHAGYAEQIEQGVYDTGETPALSFTGRFKDHIWAFMLRDLPVLFLGELLEWQGSFVTNHNAKLYAEALSFFGIPRERVRNIARPTLFPTLYVVNHDDYFVHSHSMHHRQLFLAYRERILSTLPPRKESLRTLIHRVWRRKVINEEELFDVLNKYDIDIVRMEQFPLAEQLSISANSELLIGAHGAGILVHTCFLPEKTASIELMTPATAHTMFLDTAVRELSLDYFQIPPLTPVPEKTYGWNDDFHVDIHHLKQALQSVIRTP